MPTFQAENTKKSKRKHVKTACLQCRTSKKGCDNARPCSRCVKLGLSGQCCDGLTPHFDEQIPFHPFPQAFQSFPTSIPHFPQFQKIAPRMEPVPVVEPPIASPPPVWPDFGSPAASAPTFSPSLFLSEDFMLSPDHSPSSHPSPAINVASDDHLLSFIPASIPPPIPSTSSTPSPASVTSIATTSNQTSTKRRSSLDVLDLATSGANAILKVSRDGSETSVKDSARELAVASLQTEVEKLRAELENIRFESRNKDKVIERMALSQQHAFTQDENGNIEVLAMLPQLMDSVFEFAKSVPQKKGHGIIIQDVTGMKTLYANDEVCSITGYDRIDFLTGRAKPPRLLHPASSHLVCTAVRDLTSNPTIPKVDHSNIVHVRKDGSLFNADVSVSFVRDVAGVAKFVVISVQEANIPSWTEENETGENFDRHA